jgi:VWFA-related protein
MATFRSLTVAFFVFLFALGSRAQAPDTSQLPSPTIRVTTKLVLVDVVVTDKSGKKVTGLKAEDFVVQEKGKAQKIALFTGPTDAKPSEPPQLGPGIFSNRPEFRATGGPPTVLVLDAANAEFKDQAYARQQMLKYVKEQYKPGQRIAIFTLTNSLNLLQDFTSDPEVLKKALEIYQPRQPELAQAPPPPATNSMGAVNGGRGAEATAALVNSLRSFQDVQLSYQTERRVDITLQAMRSLSRMLSGIPGRKNIVWITAAFPFSLIPGSQSVSEAELEESLPSIAPIGLGARSAGSAASNDRGLHLAEVRQVQSQLASAQIAIYPIDARGLMTGSDPIEEQKDNGGPYNFGGAAEVRMSDAQASQETMREMAHETGGVAYVNQNEIQIGVVNALDDSSSSYTIGYYPDDKKWDGKYRTIKVKVNRDGVEARYRRGYFAIDPSLQKDRKPDQEVAEALADRAPDTQVTFSAQVKPPTNGKINVTFLVDPNTISVEDAAGGSKKVNVVFYATLFAPDGKMLGNLSQKVDQAFDAATYEKIQKQGILLQMDLDAKPGDNNEVRLVVRDNRTGFMGTLNGTVPR